MPWLRPRTDAIVANNSSKQRNAWADGAEIDPALHTLEQQASDAEQPTTAQPIAVEQHISTHLTESTTTYHTTTRPAHPTDVPQPTIFYHCTITKDFFLSSLDIDFKKGMQGQLLEEREMQNGRKVVKIFVRGVTDQHGGGFANAWVPKNCVERGNVGWVHGERVV
jgi:hypothetical protein